MAFYMVFWFRKIRNPPKSCLFLHFQHSFRFRLSSHRQGRTHPGPFAALVTCQKPALELPLRPKIPKESLKLFGVWCFFWGALFIFFRFWFWFWCFFVFRFSFWCFLFLGFGVDFFFRFLVSKLQLFFRIGCCWASCCASTPFKKMPLMEKK